MFGLRQNQRFPAQLNIDQASNKDYNSRQEINLLELIIKRVMKTERAVCGGGEAGGFL